jgi:hypothetical protein
MPSIPYIKKKIGNSYLVWFQRSNLYLQLEEPAWFVFRKTVKRYKAETIASECVLRYSLTYDECLQFVNDIRTKTAQMNQPAILKVSAGNYSDKIKNYDFTPYSTRKYQFNGNLIEFSVEKARFEEYLHPLISYLETNKTADKISRFELFRYQDETVFRLNGEVKGVWPRNDTHHLIASIFVCMINEMYDKSDDFWLMTVHASAITNGRKTILIPAKSGSGKTTIAALLQTRGYQLVSDDFVPIDRELFRAWPFRIAMSVKPGAMDVLTSLYPDLEHKPVTKSSAAKIVRYLPPQNNVELVDIAFPVKEVIMIKYDPSIEFEFEKVDQLTSIKQLLDQAWIVPNPGNAGIFLDRVVQWSFYQLTYSNNQKALDAITQLFEND